MPDLTTIATAISTFNTSIDIVKALKDSTVSLSEAEQKFKMAELLSSLANLKKELSEIECNLIEKDKIIRDLKEKINQKESLTFDGKFYWKEDDKTPICQVCYDRDNLYIHLSKDKYKYICKNCNNSFDYEFEDIFNKVINNKF